VNGSGTHPLYQYLKNEKRGLFGTRTIKWNFTKFLIDRAGNAVARFAPNTTPQSLRPAIEKQL
jgi:glutathione peroxidase